MGDTRQPLAPALTAEEWECDKDGYREIEIGDLGVWHRDTPNSLGNLMVVWSVSYSEGAKIDGRGRHALAALCLYQQPFGFTHEDLELLNRCADGCDGTEDAEDDERVFADGIELRMKDVHRLQSLASRIASLLPPRTP